MGGPLDAIGVWSDRAASGLTHLASALLFAMMVVVVIDVGGRYLFNAPLEGGFELVQLGIGLLTFTALPLVTWRRRHITVDIGASLVPASMRRIRDASIHLMAALVLAVIAWRLWDQGVSLARFGETTASLGLPVAPMAYAMAVLSLVSALLCLPLALAPSEGTEAREGGR